MINTWFKIQLISAFSNVFIEKLWNIFEINFNLFFNNRIACSSKLFRIRFVSISATQTTKKSIFRSISTCVNKCRKWIRRFSTSIVANFVFYWLIIRLFKVSTNVSIISTLWKIITKFWIFIIDVIFDEDFFSKTILIKIVIFVFDWISRTSTIIFFSR